MNALSDIFRNCGNALSCAWQVLRYLGGFLCLLLLPKAAFRLYWRWKSRPGRPEITVEMQALIRKLSAGNPLWGVERMRQQLDMLGYDPPCTDTILKYMVKPRRPRKPSTTWLPFLRNHLGVSGAIDFFTVPTLTFDTLYVFVVLEHDRRRVLHWAVTPAPSMAWVVQQLREAMPYGVQPRYLFRDNDGIYGHGVRAFMNSPAQLINEHKRP